MRNVLPEAECFLFAEPDDAAARIVGVKAGAEDLEDSAADRVLVQLKQFGGHGLQVLPVAKGAVAQPESTGESRALTRSGHRVPWRARSARQAEARQRSRRV